MSTVCEAFIIELMIHIFLFLFYYEIRTLCTTLGTKLKNIIKRKSM